MRETNDPSAKASVSKPPDRSTRDRQRAEALRANLLRRKAQARGRRETEDGPADKSEGDA